MSKRLTQAQVEELRRTVLHAQPSDISSAPTGEGENVEDFVTYLSHFAAPKRDEAGAIRRGQPCAACDATDSFRWGLAHGSGYCAECGWPGTLYHFVKDRHGKDLVTFRGALLWAHPDDIEIAKPAKST